jgi:MoxR-like ATPase
VFNSEFALRIHVGMMHKNVAGKIFANAQMVRALNQFLQTTETVAQTPKGVVYDDWCNYLPVLEKAYKAGLFCLIVGPKGTGKTTLVRKFAELVQKPLYTVNFSLRTRESHLVGQFLLENGSTKFALGVIPKSMQEGAILYLDELNCFPAGVRVLTPEGYKPIEQLSEGDEVIAFDSVLRRFEVARVRKTFEQQSPMLITVHLRDGRSITCTPEHPFYTQKGWVRARDLTSSDYVLAVRSSDQVKACEEVLLPQVLLRVEKDSPTAESHASSSCEGEALRGYEESLRESSGRSQEERAPEADSETGVSESTREASRYESEGRFVGRQVLEIGRGKAVCVSESEDQLVGSRVQGEGCAETSRDCSENCARAFERYVQEARHEQEREVSRLADPDGASAVALHRRRQAMVQSSLGTCEMSRLDSPHGEEGSATGRIHQEEERFGARGCGLQRSGLPGSEDQELRVGRSDVGVAQASSLLWVEVDRVEVLILREPVRVYNLWVEPHNTFVAEGLVVHNCAEPDVLVRLDEALDDRRELVLKEAGELTIVKAKPDWWVVATVNPLSHAGTKELPPQLLSRFPVRLHLDYPPPDVEKRIVKLHVGDGVGGADLDKAIRLANKLREAAKVEDVYYSPSIRETIAFAKLVASGVSPRDAAEIVFANVYWQWGATEVQKVKDLISSLWGEKGEK